MLHIQYQFQIKIQLKIPLIMMIPFHKVDKRFHIHKVQRTALLRVRHKRICYFKERILRLILPNLNLEAVAHELNKFKVPLMKFKITSNNLQIKAAQSQDHHTMIHKKCKNFHLKISLNLREENQQVELLRRIKSQQTKAT